jgi:hypothetical protein
VRGKEKLSAVLEANRDAAMLFRRLATLRTDAPLFASVDDLRWRGPSPGFEPLAARLGASYLWDRSRRLLETPPPS